MHQSSRGSLPGVVVGTGRGRPLRSLYRRLYHRLSVGARVGVRDDVRGGRRGGGSCSRLVRIASSALVWPVFLPFAVNCVQAAGETDIDADPVLWLLEASGIETHLATVQASIASEALQALDQCPDSYTLPTLLEHQLRHDFTPATLLERIRSALHADLTSGEIHQVRQWMMSPLGARVRQAEAAVSELDEASFEAASTTLVTGDAWTPARRALISALVSATRAAGFLTAFNTEISAAVHLASACETGAEHLQAIDATIAAERRDATFYAVFMRLELIVPTGVVFEPLSDAELQAYLDFARSAAGQRYHDVLVASMQSAMRAGVTNLRVSLDDH